MGSACGPETALFRHRKLQIASTAKITVGQRRVNSSVFLSITAKPVSKTPARRRKTQFMARSQRQKAEGGRRKWGRGWHGLPAHGKFGNTTGRREIPTACLFPVIAHGQDARATSSHLEAHAGHG